jgi:hypothetical protein
MALVSIICPWCGKPMRSYTGYLFHRGRCPKAAAKTL